MKGRNLLVVLAMCIVLSAPAMLVVFDRVLDVNLPDWLTAESSSYLSGGIEKASLRKNMTLEGWNSGAFQQAIEKTLGNNIPFKAMALLGNSSLQRSAIAASNVVFGFEAYPTYFGSRGVYIPAEDAVAAYPVSSSSILEGVSKTAKGLAEFSKAHPELEFRLIMGDQSDYSDANPVSTLVSARISTEQCATILRQELQDCPNVLVLASTYSDTHEYYDNYYRTDHHWNGFGALEAYRKMNDALGIEGRAEVEGSALDFDGLLCNGSYARRYLLMANEEAHEPHIDVSQLTVEGEGPPYIMREGGAEALLAAGVKAEYDLYAQWYGSAARNVQLPVLNRALPDGGNALVLQDSFNNAFHWLIANDHYLVRCYDDIKDDRKDQTPLIDRISEVDPDVIYFVGNCAAYSRLMDKAPNYFDE